MGCQQPLGVTGWVTGASWLLLIKILASRLICCSLLSLSLNFQHATDILYTCFSFPDRILTKKKKDPQEYKVASCSCLLSCMLLKPNSWLSKGSSGKESAYQCRRCRRHRNDPWVGKIPRVGSGNSLQYSCLENSMDRRA